MVYISRWDDPGYETSLLYGIDRSRVYERQFIDVAKRINRVDDIYRLKEERKQDYIRRFRRLQLNPLAISQQPSMAQDLGRFMNLPVIAAINSILYYIDGHFEIEVIFPLSDQYMEVDYDPHHRRYTVGQGNQLIT